MGSENAKTLDQEIKRAMAPYFNHVEPSVFATVTRVHATNVDITLAVGEDTIPFYNVPVLKPCYGSESLNLAIGDKVLLIFQAGSITAPVIVGKL
nr:hypothetical protein [uncultured Methanobacterium sp.]